jgi:hypothetical protein
VRHEISISDRVEARDGRATLMVPLVLRFRPAVGAAVDAPPVGGIHRVTGRYDASGQA